VIDQCRSPKISVVVPALNAEATIARCIESVLALEWPRDGLEIIVVDNGSTDRTREIVSEHDVRLVSESAIRSPAAPRNRGVREATGELIAFIDSDCEACPRWLEAACAHFADETVGAVSGRIDSDEPRTTLERCVLRRGQLSNARALHHSFMPAFLTANVVVQRAVFDRIGVFEPRWRCGEDIDLAWRMQSGGGWRLVYEPESGVIHHHGPTLGALYRHRRAWAMGAELLEAKWPEKNGRGTKYLGKSLRCLALKAMLVLVTAPLGIVSPRVFWRQVSGVVARVADIAGRCAGRRAVRDLGVGAAAPDGSGSALQC